MREEDRAVRELRRLLDKARGARRATSVSSQPGYSTGGGTSSQYREGTTYGGGTPIDGPIDPTEPQPPGVGLPWFTLGHPVLGTLPKNSDPPIWRL